MDLIDFIFVHRVIYRLPTKVLPRPINNLTGKTLVINTVSICSKMTICYWMRPLVAPPGGNLRVYLNNCTRFERKHKYTFLDFTRFSNFVGVNKQPINYRSGIL